MKATRGSAYVFVLIMSMSLFLMLAIAANTTVYQVRVSSATKNYSNLSLLAHSGIERALLTINSHLETDRAEISERVLGRLEHGGDYATIFIEEAGLLMHTKFAGTAVVYNLTLPTDDSDEFYTVTVRITPGARAGIFVLNSLAIKDGLPTGEEVSAEIACVGSTVVREHSDNFIVVESDIGWRIQNLIQKR